MPRSRTRSRRRQWLGALVGIAVVIGVAPTVAQPAYADSAPVPPTPRTVTADALPTVQINGVVWDEVIVGDRVYVTGNFSQARPAGAAAGTNQTPRSNLLAYDLDTGNLVTTWAPNLNGQGLTIDSSDDGARIYVGGEFTEVSGVARPRLVALDANSGAVITSFNARVNSRVRTIDVDGDTLYLGGAFSAVGGQARSRLAAVAANDGAVRPWAPSVDSEVFALVAPSGTGKVVSGGRFEFANGQRVLGLGAFDATDASLLPWDAYGVFPNYGSNAAIWSLSSDGAQVFGTAYDFGGPSEFEGTFGVDLTTGEVNWVNACKGDTYDSVPVGDVVYSVGHAHDCGMVRGHPEQSPRKFQYALAMTKAAAADGRTNTYGAYRGRPAPELLHWLPTLNQGTFTGQSQAGWTVSGNGEYVVIGGEFPRVNGTNQQGLTRFRINGPNQEGPLGYPELQPEVVSLAPGAARVAWTAAWDRDNRQLIYEVLRGNTVNTSVVVGTLPADSAWWDRKPLALTDATVPPGSTQTYRVRVRDAFDNALVSAASTVTVQDGVAEASPYGDAVRTDGATSYWRLGEPSGTTSYDWTGVDDLVVDSSAQRGTPGALTEPNSATTFTGTARVPATTTARQRGPQSFSVEAWIKTTTLTGGKIVGFGNSSTGNSSSYDRHLYMTNDGRLSFGVFTGATSTVTSSNRFNDNEWHHVVATLDPTGMELFVDGLRVGRRTDTSAAQDYAGFWRVGGDNLSGWPNRPSSTSFTGAVDEVAVYPTALSTARIQAHFTASGRTPASGIRPPDSYGAAVYDAEPNFYWRLDEAAGTVAADTTANASDGAYFGGPTFGLTGAVPAGTATQFDGVNDIVSASERVSNPTVYSEELWFTTTTTRGGKLVGFGNAQSGNSSNYDRHVYMFDDGRLRFGVYTGQLNVVDTTQAYNDGQWHHLVATQGGDGMKLYVDGQLVGTNPQTAAQNYSGYWRVGGDLTWGGATSNYFAGTFDEVAVYPTVLTPEQVAEHFTAGGGQLPNQAPTASFSSNAVGLTASFDGSGSTDADGAITSYAWDFGDGQTGTGATEEHSYPAAGTYSVTLTVTDDGGATGTTTESVTVTDAPPAATDSARDTFTRDVTNGLGSADIGGEWTTHSTADYSVAEGAGRLRVPQAGAQRSAYLDSVRETDTEVDVAVSLDKAATGGGTYVSVIGRRVDSGDDYEVRLRFLSTGAVAAQLVRAIGSTDTVLDSTTAPGLTYTPGDVLRVKLRVTGIGTTTLGTRIWRQGAPEPTTWLLTGTDTTSSLQAPGGLGLQVYLSGSATNAPMTASFDDLVAGRPSGG